MKTWKIAVVLLALLSAPAAAVPTRIQDKPENAQPSAGTSAETEKATSETSDLPTVIIEASGGKKVEVRVEIADGQFEQTRGLMYRTALGRGQGHALRLPRRAVALFLDEEHPDTALHRLHRLEGTHHGHPGHEAPRRRTAPLRLLRARQYALEVNQGFFDERGVKVGDHAELPE